eukprot:SAG31_NODE_13986_length_833_cov_1.123978_1_plen_184_part_10
MVASKSPGSRLWCSSKPKWSTQQDHRWRRTARWVTVQSCLLWVTKIMRPILSRKWSHKMIDVLVRVSNRSHSWKICMNRWGRTSIKSWPMGISTQNAHPRNVAHFVWFKRTPLPRLKWLHGQLGTSGMLACGALCLTAVVKSIPKIKTSTSEVILSSSSQLSVLDSLTNEIYWFSHLCIGWRNA